MRPPTSPAVSLSRFSYTPGSVAMEYARRGTPPRAMCHPVAITGSTYLHTHLTITVPTAMLCAARSIHHSPLSQMPPPSSTPAVTAASAPPRSPPPI